MEALVTIDPVNNKKPGKLANGPVKNNVKKYRNYYQRKGGNSTIKYIDGNGNETGGEYTHGRWPMRFIGSVMDCAIPDQPQIQVEVQLANEKVEHGVGNPTDPQLGRLFGWGVNHTTMPWWCYERVINDLA